MLINKKLIAIVLSVIVGLFAFEAQAAKDLVYATVSSAGANNGANAAVTSALPGQLKVSVPVPVAYHFVNQSGTQVTDFAVKAVMSGPVQFAMTSNTCPTVLDVGASCDLTGTVTATGTGIATFQIRLVEGRNTFLLHQETVSTFPLLSMVFDEAKSTRLASQYYINESAGASYTFTNTGNGDVTLSSVVVSPAGIVLPSDSCSSATVIAPGASCTIPVKLDTSTVNPNYTVQITFTYNGQTYPTFVDQTRILNPSALTVVSTPNRLLAFTGETAQGIVTLSSGEGEISKMNYSFSSPDSMKGALTVDPTSTCTTSLILEAGQTCNYVIDYKASSDMIGTVNNPSVASAVPTFTVSYNDGRNSPSLQIPVAVYQADNNYFINVPNDLPGLKGQLPSDTINAVTVANNANGVPVLYVGTPYGLSMSTNHGATWADVTTLDGLSSNNIKAIFANGDNIAVATDNGIAFSLNGGVSFTNESLANVSIVGVPQAIVQTSSAVYVGTSFGLYSRAVGTNGVFAQVSGISGSVTQLSYNSGSNTVYAINNGSSLYANSATTPSAFAVVNNITQNGVCGSTQADYDTIYGFFVPLDYRVPMLAATKCNMRYAVGSSPLSFDKHNLGTAGSYNIVAAVGGVSSSSAKAVDFYGINTSGNLEYNINGSGWKMATLNIANPSLLAVEPNGNYLYVASATGGLEVGTVSNGDVTFSQIAAGILPTLNTISAILPLNNNVYVGTGAGLYNFGLPTATVTQTVSAAVYGLSADCTVRVYVATNDGLQYSLDGQNFTSFGNMTSYSSVAFDGENTLYTVAGDLSKDGRMNYSTLSADGVPGSLTEIRGATFVAASNGQYALVSKEFQVACFSDSVCSSIGSVDNTVNFVAYLNGLVYYSQDNGVNIYDGINPVTTIALGGSNAGQLALYDNNVYVATSNGVYEITGTDVNQISAVVPQSFNATGAAALSMNGNALYVVSGGQLLMTHVPLAAQSSK